MPRQNDNAYSIGNAKNPRVAALGFFYAVLEGWLRP